MSKLSRILMLVFLSMSVLLLAGCLNSTAQYQTGRDNFIEGDYHQAFRRLEPAAQQGNGEAQYAIGYMYFYGLGTVQDQQLALQWIRAAADKGQPQAKQALSDLRHTPQGNMRAFSIQRPGALSGRSQPRSMPSRSYQGSDSHSSSYQEPAKKQPLNAAWPKARQETAPALDFTAPPPPTSPPATPPVAPQATGMDLSQKQATKLAKQTSLASSQDRYTVQIAGSYDVHRLEQYVYNNHLQGKVQKYKTSRRGEDWYVLGYGQYASKNAAHDAMEKLPSSVIQSSPWVRQMANLQQVQTKLG